jgi:DNA modification methylase
MPESVTDRCTKAHEYLFLLSKSRRYYFDHVAIKEPAVGGKPGNTKPTKGGRAYDAGAAEHRTAANLHRIGAVEFRNRRSVWDVATRPYRGAHFATFPPDLIEPCIKAGSREGDTILDPFNGAGTTGLVAARLGRNYIGIELNTGYCEMSRQRISAGVGA